MSKAVNLYPVIQQGYKWVLNHHSKRGWNKNISITFTIFIGSLALILTFKTTKPVNTLFTEIS